MARVLVVGLAETGVSVTRRLRGEGFDVAVLEDAPAGTDRYRTRVTTVRNLGARLLEAPAPDLVREIAAGADLVVPSPLVRADHVAVQAARAAGVPVRSEIDLAAERAKVPIVAVTGTNGKTTVTTMITAVLLASGVRARAAGNIGRPLLDAIADRDVDVLVAEISSFQLEFTEVFRPAVAVLLAITPDHLDWHGTFAGYVAAKAHVTDRQGPDDVLVYDADDARAAEVAAGTAARAVGVSLRAEAEGCYRVVRRVLVLPDSSELLALDSMRRTFMHDRTNALAAAAAAFEVGGTLDGARAALASYATMPHRVALVGEANGVRWYDDSKATNPDAALRAIASFDSVVLLAGGRNKGLDLAVLASQAERLRSVIAFGEAAAEVVEAFSGTDVKVFTAPTIPEAVHEAAHFAQPGDVVLLSPACASFDAYAGYAARGDDFVAAVQAEITTDRGAS